MPVVINRNILLRFAFLLALLSVFYYMGVSFQVIAILGAISAVFLLFRDRIRSSIDRLMHMHVPGFKDMHPYAKAALLLIVFIAVYMVLKQIVYLILSLFGFDVQASIQDTINQ